MTVLAVTNIKGGVGKTTTAVNLAWLAAHDGEPTLLWDLDPQGAASFTLRVRPELPVGAARLLRDEDAFAEAIKGSDFPRLDIVPADFSCRKLDAILARADGRGRGLERPLRALRSTYRYVVLDCPPGFSFLAENIFSAADALVIPTIPTALSLRTLARLARHLADRRARTPLLLPFLNMVDRRRSLHRAVADHVQASAAPTGASCEPPSPWLHTEVPHATVIEQMGVERAPVGVFAGDSSAAESLRALWTEVVAALGRPRDDDVLRAACTQLAEDTEALLTSLQSGRVATSGAAGSDRGAVEGIEDADAAVRAPDVALPLNGIDLELTLGGESDATALVRATGLAGEQSVAAERLEHVFDTEERTLALAGCTLRLLEEGGRFVLLARCPVTGEARSRIDSRWAFEVLAGSRAPLDVLVERGGATPLLDRLRQLAGSRSTPRVASLRNVRRRIGPFRAAGNEPEGHPLLTLEIARTDLLDGSVRHRVEVSLPHDDASAAERDLRQLFDRAGLIWLSGGGPPVQPAEEQGELRSAVLEAPRVGVSEGI